MRSLFSSPHPSHMGFSQPPNRSSFSSAQSFLISFSSCCPTRGGLSCSFDFKFSELEVSKCGYRSKRRFIQVTAMDEDSFGGFSLDELGPNEGPVPYMLSSSDGEDSDGDVILQPLTDVDLPTKKEQFRHDDAVTVTVHRLAMLGKSHKRKRIKYGILNNIGLVTFLIVLLLLVDLCAWRIVRLPLDPFHLMRPFGVSAILVACAGYIGVPLLRAWKIQSIIQREQPSRHSSNKGTPTMGGLFFVPVGVIVAGAIVSFSSIEVSAAAVATLAFAVIGLIDDYLSLTKNHNNGLSVQMRLLLQVAVGMWFSFWLYTTDVSSPYCMYTFLKLVVPLPSPVGLVCLGKSYLLLTSFCFVSMGNGIKLTDGLDGLAGGTAALAFVGMTISVLPICPELAVFGASMAGACVGFLLHSRYKASIFMGDTGSLAIGGALASMAACTGMFFPLLISSGIFVLESLSVVLQVTFFKGTKCFQGTGRRFFRMAPFHHHLQLMGVKDPVIVACAYVISCFLVLLAAYTGLTSV